MKTTVSLSRCRVRGQRFWRVRWHDQGKVKRKFFTGREAAEAHASKLREEAVGVRQLLAAIPQPDQEKLVMLYNEAQRRGVDLLALLAAPTEAPSLAPSLQNVLNEMVVAKRNSGRSARYLYGLQNVLEKFIRGREELPVDKISLHDVEAFLDARKLCSRSTLRARIASLMNFAVRRGYRMDNPTARLEASIFHHKTPAVFTVKEVEKCLKWLRKNPHGLGWFVLSTFAGLRPEEAQLTTWQDVHFKEGWIRVEAQTSKVRQRRVVYPLPMVMAWLKLAKKLNCLMPLGEQGRRYCLLQLRAQLGWSEWKQDCTRHTAASMWLAHTGSAEKVATALGHSESVLRKHYMALVTKADAEKFWNLLPSAKPA